MDQNIDYQKRHKKELYDTVFEERKQEQGEKNQRKKSKENIFQNSARFRANVLEFDAEDLFIFISV
jgi:hypothetical protein